MLPFIQLRPFSAVDIYRLNPKSKLLANTGGSKPTAQAAPGACVHVCTPVISHTTRTRRRRVGRAVALVNADAGCCEYECLSCRTLARREARGDEYECPHRAAGVAGGVACVEARQARACAVA
jgi:hypothetical protein